MDKGTYLGRKISFFLALLVAFSRVYLSQHFLIDITVGSIIGSTGALGFYLLYYRDDRKWHAWSLKRIFNHEHKS
jgi:membrane-associated phospholipid phosphatase